jgi:hypothetical protein
MLQAQSIGLIKTRNKPRYHHEARQSKKKVGIVLDPNRVQPLYKASRDLKEQRENPASKDMTPYQPSN